MSTYLDRTFRAGQRAPFTLDGLGESQSYYSRIDNDQKALTVRLAEIAAADQGAWDAVWTALQGKYIPNTITWFLGWGFAKQQILDAWKTLMPNNEPGEAEFSKAERLLADTEQMVAYFKRTVPESAVKIQQEAAAMRNQVASITPLLSPEQVGWDTFNASIAERADSMLSKFSWGAGLGIAAIAAIGLIFLSRSR